MLYDLAWHARTSRVFSGALRVWGVPGTVRLDGKNGFIIVPGTGAEIQVCHHAPAGWAATLRDPVSGAQVPLGRHAGLPGLLRGLRERLAPHAPAGRLVIGAQLLLWREADGQ